jgi:hypothetical protein
MQLRSAPLYENLARSGSGAPDVHASYKARDNTASDYLQSPMACWPDVEGAARSDKAATIDSHLPSESLLSSNKDVAAF